MKTKLSNEAEIQSYVKEHNRIRVCAGGSKTALSAKAEVDISALRGVISYDPSEYTITVKAATPIAELDQLLAEKGQYLAFDPPLDEAGATLAGTVAAGLSGSGRWRYGGVRDFILGLKWVTGEGHLQRGGAKVVKNAAGFDLPKLMVGSLGRLGIITEVTMKVFPKPASYQSLRLQLPSFSEAVTAMQSLAQQAFELSSLDLLPPHTLLLRIGGAQQAVESRTQRLQDFLGQPVERLQGDKEAALWQYERNFRWLPQQHSLIKIPLNPKRLCAFEQALEWRNLSLERRYAVAGNVVYLAWDDKLEQQELRQLLADSGLSGLALTGSWAEPLLGKQPGQAFLASMQSVLDPEKKFR